jgi:hypothetical protein
MVERELNAPPNDTDYKFRIRNLKLFKKVSKEARIRALTEDLMGRSILAKKYAKVSQFHTTHPNGRIIDMKLGRL